MIRALESEQAVLGAALYDASWAAEARERLRPEHFSEPAHAALWALLGAEPGLP
ncbi:MAG: DnaB-like helicase N-terminal domain-containing protein, partial [Candidatus Dormibacteria bacterium]